MSLRRGVRKWRYPGTDTERGMAEASGTSRGIAEDVVRGREVVQKVSTTKIGSRQKSESTDEGFFQRC